MSDDCPQKRSEKITQRDVHVRFGIREACSPSTGEKTHRFRAVLLPEKQMLHIFYQRFKASHSMRDIGHIMAYWCGGQTVRFDRVMQRVVLKSKQTKQWTSE